MLDIQLLRLQVLFLMSLIEPFCNTNNDYIILYVGTYYMHYLHAYKLYRYIVYTLLIMSMRIIVKYTDSFSRLNIIYVPNRILLEFKWILVFRKPVVFFNYIEVCYILYMYIQIPNIL